MPGGTLRPSWLSQAPPVTLDFRDTVRPNYLKNTMAHTDHSKTLARTSRTSGAVQLSNRLAGRLHVMTTEQRAIEEAAQKRRQIMANTMPIAQRAKEEEDLRTMREKLHFLRNPRHATEHVSTFRHIFGRTMPIAVSEKCAGPRSARNRPQAPHCHAFDRICLLPREHNHKTHTVVRPNLVLISATPSQPLLPGL